MADRVLFLSEVVELDAAQSIVVDKFCLEKGFSRRKFLGYAASMAAVLALPKIPFAAKIATAVAAAPRLPVIWLNGQDCNGNIESFLKAPNPTFTDILLTKLDIEYLELVMAPGGLAAEKSLDDLVAKGGYVTVIEGSIPTGANGAYCVINGEAFTDRVRRVTANSLAVVAVGACAVDGGLPHATGGVTGAVGCRDFLGAGPTIVALPGCPSNGVNLAGVFVQYLALQSWPELDQLDRPLFAYGAEVHGNCTRKPHFDAGEFVLAWGDEGHQKGWCLRQMGCQGPETHVNCPTRKWNGGQSWPVDSGAPCFGCTNPDWWDVPGGFFSPRSSTLPTPV